MGHFLSESEKEQESIVARGFSRAWFTSYADFERTGALSDLETAIWAIRGALSLTPDGHPDKPRYFNNLGISFESRFGRIGLLSDLEDAIRNKLQAVSLTPDDHADKPMYLHNLGMSFQSRFGRTGTLSNLKDAIKHKQQAVLLTPVDDPDKAGRLNSLGISFRSQFERTGMLSSIEEAIASQQQSVSLTPNNHPHKPRHLSNLGNSFETLFQRTGKLSDLEEAIRNKQQAVSLTPDDHIDKPMYLNNLGNSLQSRFWCTGALSSLEDAIATQRQAVSLTPDDHHDKPRCLNNLGNSFEVRFRHTGRLSDLEDAIKNKQQALTLTPDDHPDKLRHLNNLGDSFQSRFGRTGMLSDLEDAIRNKQQAVSLAPDDHPDKPTYLNNLGNSFQSRFGRTGMLSDLEEAIKHKRQAVSLTPDDHADKPMRLSNLGNSLQSRSKRTGVLSDLEEAIKTQEQAVFLTPDGHSDKPMCLNNLGISFESRFRRTRILSDLEEAIKHLHQAVCLAPDGHADKPMYLNNLGNALESRFWRTRMLSSLEEAVENHQRAVALTPDGHANKPIYLNNLGIACYSQFYRTGSLNSLDEAISSMQLAATSNIGPALLRCQASQRWARLEANRNPPAALIAYRQAINLLPQVAWIGDPIAARHSQLTPLGEIPREAAAFALDVGHPDLALEWLEQGRSIVWNQLLHLRTPVDHLRQAHPDLCAEFTQTSHELQNAATRGHNANTADDVQNPISLEEDTQRHHRLAEKWELLVEKIRSLPKFQDFLLPKKASALMDAASSGPIVVINVHERRCDALALVHGRDQVLHIPLNKLHYDDLKKMHHLLRQYLANPYRGRRWENRAGGPALAVGGSLIVEILEELYSKVVYPILQGLDMTTARSEPSSLPRIWWCPAGPLTFFPLHAACCTTRTKTDGTFDYVVSSYAPTINALLEARLAKRQPFSQLVGIAMTDTPGQSSLPGVETEIAKIEKLFAADSRWNFEVLRNEQATGERVLSHMTNSNWVHLACHAIQDKQEPTRSGFCLHDRRLTIMDIVAKPFGYADLAFLSACQTAAGDEKASDEAVHITGAMLGAGYRSVIGTMWAIPDEVASKIAAKVYEILLSGGEPDSDRAAQALHEAVREVRESSHDLFNFWAPFVHYGA